MELSITRTDGTSDTASVSMADIIAFERKFDKSYADVESDMRIEYMAFLAWNSLRRTGRETRTFDDFVDQIEDFEAAEAPLVTENAS